MKFSITANRILLLSLLQGVLVIVLLLGPFIGIGVNSVFVCGGVSLLYFLFGSKMNMTIKYPASEGLLRTVRAFYIASASSVIPVILFLYLGAENWVKTFAAMSVLFCAFGCGKLIDRLAKLK